MNKKTLKTFNEYFPMIIVGLLLITWIISVFVLPAIDSSKMTEEEILAIQNRTGGPGVATFGSIIEITSGDYDGYLLVDGPLYLERVQIGESISGAGIILSNATANNNDAVVIMEAYSAPVGSIEIGAYLDMGLLITTSPLLNASFIYTPMPN